MTTHDLQQELRAAIDALEEAAASHADGSIRDRARIRVNLALEAVFVATGPKAGDTHTQPLAVGAAYWGLVQRGPWLWKWSGCDSDLKDLAEGLCFTSEKAAQDAYDRGIRSRKEREKAL